MNIFTRTIAISGLVLAVSSPAFATMEAEKMTCHDMMKMSTMDQMDSMMKSSKMMMNSDSMSSGMMSTDMAMMMMETISVCMKNPDMMMMDSMMMSEKS